MSSSPPPPNTNPSPVSNFFPPPQKKPSVLQRRLPPHTQPTQSLTPKLLLGSAAAIIVSIPLSLGVTVIDRSVTLFANGAAPSLRSALFSGFRAVARAPHVAFMGLDNRAVFGVYGATYVAKNAAVITSEHGGVDPKWPMFFATIVVNGGLGIMKDKYLAKMFGTGVGGGSFPMASYASFLTRDAILIGVSFVGAPLIAPTVQEFTGLSPVGADIVTQISVPACAQLLATPVHLVGLDFYNRPEVGGRERVVDAIRNSRGPIAIRMFRQGYVFGFGSLCVKYLTMFMLDDV